LKWGDSFYCVENGKKAHLDVLGKLVVAVDVHSVELTHFVEFELDLDRLAVLGVVAPADPPLACEHKVENKPR
jgi:hypothetical protein